MLENLIYMAIALLVSFIIARVMKDHRVYTRLVLVILLGFVIGSAVKETLVSKTNDTKEIVTEEVSIPMLHLSEAVTTEEDNNSVASKELLSDISVTIPKVVSSKPNNLVTNPEFINDS